MTSLCPVCSSELPESKTRPVVYCSNSCSLKASRQRKKMTRISSVSEKVTRISKKTAPDSKKVVSITGTVQRLPVVIKSSEIPVRYICRTFEDMKALLDGRVDELEIERYVSKESPCSITSGLLSRGDLNHD